MSTTLPRFIIRDRAASLIDWGVVLLCFLSGVLFQAFGEPRVQHEWL